MIHKVAILLFPVVVVGCIFSSNTCGSRHSKTNEVMDNKSVEVGQKERLEIEHNKTVFGYPEAIPLDQAVLEFNDGLEQSVHFSSFPKLTEDEVIAAIVAGADYGSQGSAWQAKRAVLWAIAKNRMLPKGSLLSARTGPREVESILYPSKTIVAKGITIALILDLDKYEDGLERPPTPEQVLIIRKNYSHIEEIDN